MNDYQTYIAKSRYCKWKDKEGRRENWSEVVDRYIDFWRARYPELGSYFTSVLTPAIFNLEVLPSMRAMMTAGKALERDNVAGYNPVHGDTLVLTKELGDVPIKTLVGKEYTVLNKDANWTTATFNSYGTQEIFDVTLRLNSNSIKTVKCTANHRWLLEDGTVKATANLNIKDTMPFVSAPKAPIDADYYDGVRHGIIYGDGTAIKAHKRVRGYHIRLCGNSSELLTWFNEYPVCYPPSANGDPVVMMYDGFAATHSLKELPIQETESYLLGFIRGWLAADGSVSRTSQVSLCASEKAKEWLLINAGKLGFVIQRVSKQPSETNYGKRNHSSYVIYFSRSSIIEDDLLCSWKKANFKPLKSTFTVVSVEATNTSSEVFCAEVPDTNTFVLDGGLVTGNCAYLAVDSVRSFDEAAYILMCGTGVGFSVERQYINQLPVVPEELHDSETTIHVRDSKIGWATAYREFISLLYAGNIPKWDLSKIRPAGARLKTMGGRASGPEPLDDLFRFTVTLFKKAVGRKLNSIECHDLMCKIADIVVVGGVRRSALISLSNLTDERMRGAKSGQWWEEHPERALANNSVCYTEKPDISIFMKEWQSLYDSKSGERGIFNRVAATKKVAESGRRDTSFSFGCNPCSEIILRPKEFCNLTEVVIRPEDTYSSLREKVILATVLGTLQSTLTNFRYLTKEWKNNCEEERLLGVSLTGIMDHKGFSGKGGIYDDEVGIDEQPYKTLEKVLKDLKEVAIETNKEWATKLGINPSTAITCVKPSGTVSQLVDSASGIHPRYAPYYVRTVRSDNKDPITAFMKAQGVPWEPDVTKPETTTVFSFPMKAPEGSVTRNEMSAIEQLKLWMVYQDNWCEHKPSQTVYYKDDEFLEVGSWVYKNFDKVSGISFLPHTDHVYKQAPYQEITKEEYEALIKKMPVIDWDKLSEFETEDNTENVKEYACSGDKCELV